jgi:hypothetical protein
MECYEAPSGSAEHSEEPGIMAHAGKRDATAVPPACIALVDPNHVRGAADPFFCIPFSVT